MDDVVFGYVHDFGTGEEWTATRGEGAWLNGEPLGGDRPKEKIEMLALEATVAASVADKAAAFAPLAQPPADHGLAGALALPPRRRPRRRGLLARRRRARSTSPPRSCSCASSGCRSSSSTPARSTRARSTPQRVRRSPRRDAGALRAAGAHRSRRLERPLRIRLETSRVEQPSREQITEALGKVIDPELKRPVTELDMVREVRVEGGHVAVTIALTVAGCPLRSSFENQVREHLLPLPGVESVSLEFDVMSPDERAALTQQAARRRHRALEGHLASTPRRACSRSRAARAASASRRCR